MAITKTAQIEQKIQEYKDHCLLALSLYSENKNSHCVQDFRKSCEALFKILIFSQYGDLNGLKIILGEVDIRLRNSNNRVLLYYQLFEIAKKTSKYKIRYSNAFEDIQKYGNDGSRENINFKDCRIKHVSQVELLNISGRRTKSIRINNHGSSGYPLDKSAEIDIFHGIDLDRPRWLRLAKRG